MDDFHLFKWSREMSKVLMYSGGMDSYIISRVFDFDVFVFVLLGNEDNKREYERVLQDPFILEKLETVDLSALGQFELLNKILPFRNHILALIGAQYGSEVYFGFTGGDTTKDKDFVFKSQMEGIMNYFALDQHKVLHTNYPYTVNMPYKEYSKGQMVAEYAESGYNIDDLKYKSRSCYSNREKECGQCRSCHRKYVALASYGYLSVDYFETDPVPYLRDFLVECEAKGRFEQEINEIKKVLDHYE
jgi:7-cyano-7-deazaguanine synthase